MSKRVIVALSGGVDSGVMLDAGLADPYGVETGILNRAVKRNIDRFPSDFMFQLTEEEFKNLRFHFGTSSKWGGRRPTPCIHGAADC